MKTSRYVVALACVAALLLMGLPAAAAPESVPERVKGNGIRISPPDYKPGEVIVKWKDGASAPARNAAMKSAGADSVRLTGNSGREVLLLSSGTSAEAAAKALNANPAVEAAGLNRLRRQDYTPSTPDFSKQYAHKNTGQSIKGHAGVAGADIDSTKAWDIETGDTSSTVAAVVDSGIDLTHPNLAGRLWTNAADPVDGIDNDGNGYTDDYHGYNFSGISDYSMNMDWSFGMDTDSQEVAQKFTARGVNGQCSMGGLEMAFYGKAGTPTQTMTFSVQGVSPTGEPDGVNIVASDPIPASRVNSEGFTFLSEPFTSSANLVPDQQYFFVARTSHVDNDNYFYIIDHLYDYYNNDFDTYLEGSEWWNFEGTWTEFDQDDFYFKGYGTQDAHGSGFGGNGYYHPRDTNGHGTHCAGIIAGADNGTGPVGVAFGNKTKMMALRVGDSSGSMWSEDFMNAWDYAASWGVDVVSNSFGGTNSDPVEQTSINNAVAAGCTFFASSGNSHDSTIQYPVGYDNVIGVGATDNRDAHADFSTYNKTVDLSAPGVNYFSAFPTYPVGMSWWFDPSQDFMSGTSMACPCAAGVGALLKSRFPSWTPAQVQERLEATAMDLGGAGRDNYFGWGRVNAFRALNPPKATITSLSPSTGSAGDTVTINGKDFLNSRGGSTSCVMFGSVKATNYVSWSNTRIKVKVPAGVSGTVPVTARTTAGTSNVRNFKVPTEEGDHTWYLAEGTTSWGFDCYVSILNPNNSEVTARLTYMPTGEANRIQEIKLPANSRATVSPADTLGQKDFSTKVECLQKKTITVDRTMTWTGGSGEKTGMAAHNSVGVTSPATDWYLPEGSTNWGFECWLLIQNPNAKDAKCSVTYMIEGKESVTKEKIVPARSRATFNMAEDIGLEDASIQVHCDLPVIPERAMYRDNRRMGHDSIGTTTTGAYYLAEGTSAWGFTTYVLIQNPYDAEVAVNVTYMTDTGPVPHPGNPLVMPAKSRKTIRVNDVLPDRDFSTMVEGTAAIIAERAMYWDAGTGEGGHDSIGMPDPHRCFYLPDGQVGSGMETWTLVQNPGLNDVTIEVTYMTPDGKGNKTFTDKVPGGSRKSYNMADAGISGRAGVLVKCTTSGYIICERSMYFDDRSGGTDTIGGYSE